MIEKIKAADLREGDVIATALRHRVSSVEELPNNDIQVGARDTNGAFKFFTYRPHEAIGIEVLEN